MNNLELRHGIFADSDCLKEYVNKQKVEELEKIKDKIEWESKGQTGAFIKAYKVLNIIDNHIAELKGEN